LIVISVLSSASIAAHLYSYVYRERSFFVLLDLGGEGNVSSWLSSTLLLAAAGLLFVIGRTSRSALAGRWRFLSFLFYVAMDETAQLHEFTIPPLRTALHLGGLFYFSWVVVAISILAYLAIRYFPLLKALPDRVRKGIDRCGRNILRRSVGNGNDQRRSRGITRIQNANLHTLD
jgi:hypothetical protein